MENSHPHVNMKQFYIQLRNRFRYSKLRSVKRKEIQHLFSHNPILKEFELSDTLCNKIKLFWKKHGLHASTLWHKAYIGVNGIEDHRYIPEDIFYVFIEPRLNRKDLYLAYVDKNNYDKLFPGNITPKTILRNINGRYYDGNYEGIENSKVCDYLKNYQGVYIAKPSFDSSGARNVMKLLIDSTNISIDGSGGRHGFSSCRDGNCATILDIEKIIPRDYLIQEFLEQHQVLNNIYPHSVNTMRVVTLRMNNTIHTLKAIAKFGTDGHYVDYNIHCGGVNCGIDDEGKLNKIAVDKYFRTYSRHPYTNYIFENTCIPHFPSVLAFAKNLHRYLLYFDMVSWDIAIDKNGRPVLIELNLINQGFSFIQVHHGPLFGDFTDELLDGNLKCYNT